MLDHVIITVSDFARSIAFYEQALKPLGITDLLDYKGQDGHPDLKGFGKDGRFFFWLKEGRPDPDTVHFGLVAGGRFAMRGTHWAASRQREYVTGRRFTSNSLRKRR